jgi:hypothetical protein
MSSTGSLSNSSCPTTNVLSTRALSNGHLYRDYVNLPPPPPYPGTSSTSSHHDHSTSNISVGSNGKKNFCFEGYLNFEDAQ